MPQTLALPDLSVDLVRTAQVVKGPLKLLPVPELQRMELDYRRFLALIAEHSNVTLAPTQAIDEMWHLHMLHPVAYHQDCMAFLGYLLDHDAGFGVSDEERPTLEAFFDHTSDLWQQTFGQAYQAAEQGRVASVHSMIPPPCSTKPKPEPEPKPKPKPKPKEESDVEAGRRELAQNRAA